MAKLHWTDLALGAAVAIAGQAAVQHYLTEKKRRDLSRNVGKVLIGCDDYGMPVWMGPEKKVKR